MSCSILLKPQSNTSKLKKKDEKENQEMKKKECAFNPI